MTEPCRGGRISRLALAANSGILFLLLLSAADAPFLFGSQNRIERSSPLPKTPSSIAERVVLIVVDGLRLSTATDPDVMPFLAGLGRRGGRGIALVENIVPSSIAAIDTIATGRNSPPAGFLADFKAPAAKEGGIFAAVSQSGATSFVAGPSLWTDRYGKWITASEDDRSFGSEDARLLIATLRALKARDDILLIVHFSCTDFAAHQSGTKSEYYRAAAAWSDRAIEQIESAIGDDTALIVTSDHGNRAAGGHAGREPSVVQTPLMVSGPGLPQGDLGIWSQRMLGAAALQAVGISTPIPESVPQSGVFRISRLLCVATLALFFCLRIWSTIASRDHPLRDAFVLDGAAWTVLVAILRGQAGIALIVGFSALAAVSLRIAVRSIRPYIVLVAFGLVLGAIRLADGAMALRRAEVLEAIVSATTFVITLAIAILAVSTDKQTSTVGPAPGLGWYSTAFVGLLLLYFLSGTIYLYVGAVITGLVTFARLRRFDARWLGACFVVTSVLLLRAASETVSLSTIDVRAAFMMIERDYGLAFGILSVIATQSAPIVGQLIGMSAIIRSIAAPEIGRLTASVAAVIAGEAIVGSVAMLAQDPTHASLGLGLSMRCLAECLYINVGMFFVLLVARPREEKIFPCGGPAQQAV